MDNIIQHVVSKDEMLVVQFTTPVSAEEFERISGKLYSECFMRNIDLVVLEYPLGVSNSLPVHLQVPVGSYSEVDLMGALNTVATHFQKCTTRSLGQVAIQRAARWFNSKFGA